MACFAIFKGGAEKTWEEANEALERLNYLVMAVTAFHPIMAKGPWCELSGLRYMFRRLKPDARCAALKLAREIASGLRQNQS